VDEELFGRYRLLDLIGQGGMGQVYRAHDTEIGRDVAIKVLPADLLGERGYVQRFRREAYTVARLNEPHIIPVYDTGEINGRLYLVMPIVDGIDLHTLLLERGAMTPELAVKIIEQVAAALDTAHSHGLVHRDVKPSNMLMTPSEFVYLIDFGIAHDESETRITQTGSVLGTVAYMAPERFSTGHADARADIYALACVLHECLTGQAPYPGGSLEHVMAGHLTKDPPRPTSVNPAVPAAFDSVIAAGMAKDPQQRYQSASDLAAAAREALHNSPRPPQPSSAAPTIVQAPQAPQAPQDDVATVAYPASQSGDDMRTVAAPKPAAPARQGSAARSPKIAVAVATALALAAVAAALIGIGAVPLGGDLAPGAVTINGADPTGNHDVPVDLSKPIPVAVTAAGADEVTMSLDILGLSVGKRESQLSPGEATTVAQPVNRYVLAGAMPAEVTVLRDHTPLGTQRFTLRSNQSAATTATAAATVIIVLIAGAYLESHLRVLRRGRERPSSVVAVPLFAAALAVAVVAAAWILLGNPPTVATLVVSAGLGACAGLAAAIGAGQSGRHARDARARSRRG
jgi:tRNA A-37 threonylcarbamoyl transferase component Bud32